MSYKKVFILSFILVISLLSVFGCDLLPQESGSQPEQMDQSTRDAGTSEEAMAVAPDAIIRLFIIAFKKSTLVKSVR